MAKPKRVILAKLPKKIKSNYLYAYFFMSQYGCKLFNKFIVL